MTTNAGGNISFNSGAWDDGATIDDVVNAINKTKHSIGAETVRAVGALHSCSDCIATHPRGRLVEMRKGNTVRDIQETPVARRLAANHGRRLVEVRSNVAIREVLSWLDRRSPEAWTLPSIGNYTGQTLVGAVSTSTHGTMLDVGPISAAVRSVLIVDGDAKIRRIEPARDRISDPAAMAAQEPGVELTVDDDLFDSVVVSLGSMGIIWSVTVEAVPQFWLREVRTNTTWEGEVRQLLLDGYDRSPSAHGEPLVGMGLVVGAYPNHTTQHRAFITRWYRSDAPLAASGAACIGTLIDQLLVVQGVATIWPTSTNRMATDVDHMFNMTYPGASGEATNIAHNIMGTDYRGHVPRGFGAEFIMPYSLGATPESKEERRQYVQLIDHVLSLLWSARGRDLYFGGWIALRFVKRFDAPMSMFYGRDSACVELLTLTAARNSIGTVDYVSDMMLRDYQNVRPHWGLASTVAKNHIRTNDATWDSARYPALPKWMAARQRLDPKGIFSNPTLQRLGLDY